MRVKIATVFATLLLVCSTVQADIRLPRLFGDNLVLQQQTKNAIWGWAEPGEKVMVSASWGASASTKSDSRGRWNLFLETPGHGTGHSLTVTGDNKIEITNVAVGEVWLCAGQSNMGWSTDNSFEAEKETSIDLPNFRIFKSQREHWHQPLEESRDRLQQWKPCDPESAAETSAVSYYFGKTLHQELDVPVGIIVQAYAGTPIEGWMPWDIQSEDARAVEHKESLDKNAQRIIARGETIEKAVATFDQELAEYNAKIAAGETMKNAFRPLQPPFITKPASLGHQYPAHIFNAMIHPVRPYGIRGMIWYQGERNSKNVPQAVHYRSQLAKLIRYYRSSWHERSAGNVADGFPFQFTQLPSWNPPQTKPVEGLEASWAANREAMRQVERDVANSGMVVSIDTGDAVELHPKNKKPLGIRHALLALQQTYGKKIVGRGPRFTSHRVQDSKIVLEFDSVGSGLMAGRQGSLDAFAIAGEDRQWRWADAEISGGKVVVSSKEVPQPVAVRYAWAMNPSQRNLLYNKEGLPASPFRTDGWRLFDANDEIVEVNKPQKPEGYQAVDWERPAMTQAANIEEESPESNGLAPEVTDLNAEDISYQLEHQLPYLSEPFFNLSPEDKNDGIAVGELGRNGGDREVVLKFARGLAKESKDAKSGKTDSLLICYQRKLIFESYFRRGRINYPHYQMSITKSYTAMVIGRAIQLGHLTMEDLDKPAISFLNDLQPEKLVEGADNITLHQAMHMSSGIRLAKEKVDALRKTPKKLKGQGQIQAYLEHSAPIPPAPREFKYQGADPSITMQVLEAVVPGSARDFIRNELWGRLGVSNYHWQADLSGLPKSAAGSSFRSRDMLKMGLLVLNNGKWQGQQLIPADFVQRATSPIRKTYGKSSYGYFWWTEDYEIDGKTYHCKQGRGAGGQFIFMFPDLDLIAVITAHNKGMGDLLHTLPRKLIPAFADRQ
ncbi:MAG: serine hydrolase [Gammaproteobacteria bacterium]|nr:serine hydrolase [Fuerstiella sp.]MCP4766390.1 serine hydrolase [Gammaproteobacteria bacterium]